MTALFALLSMLARDSAATLLTISEARGKALKAAGIAALMDGLGVLVTIFGAIQIDQKGFAWSSAGILAAMMAASGTGTYFTVRYADVFLGLGDKAANRQKAGGN